jgi:hypothetical protein
MVLVALRNDGSLFHGLLIQHEDGSFQLGKQARVVFRSLRELIAHHQLIPIVCPGEASVTLGPGLGVAEAQARPIGQGRRPPAVRATLNSSTESAPAHAHPVMAVDARAAAGLARSNSTFVGDSPGLAGAETNWGGVRQSGSPSARSPSCSRSRSGFTGPRSFHQRPRSNSESQLLEMIELSGIMSPPHLRPRSPEGGWAARPDGGGRQAHQDSGLRRSASVDSFTPSTTGDADSSATGGAPETAAQPVHSVSSPRPADPLPNPFAAVSPLARSATAGAETQVPAVEQEKSQAEWRPQPPARDPRRIRAVSSSGQLSADRSTVSPVFTFDAVASADVQSAGNASRVGHRDPSQTSSVSSIATERSPTAAAGRPGPPKRQESAAGRIVLSPTNPFRADMEEEPNT